MAINIAEHHEYLKRHLGPNLATRREMLKAIGVSSMEQLIDETVPAGIRLKKELNLAPGITEFEFLKKAREIAAKNKLFRSYIGLGYYNTITPSVILRNILENPGWYTQYTPYQAEIAQGRLEALLNYQTMVIDLTGMEVANASLLDEATAAAEAMTMLYRLRSNEQVKNDALTFLASEDLFPQTLAVLKTRAVPLGIKLVVMPHKEFSFSDDVFGAMVQYPCRDGRIENYAELIQEAHKSEARVAVAADLLALTLLTPPGEWDADVVVGSSQRFGVPPGYGGPHAGFFATREDFVRQVPGRIIGVSKDRLGNNGYRMALQTREQHIRGARATSNICTAQSLLAIMASMYGVYHGPDGLKRIAARVHQYAVILEKALKEMGYEQLNENFFDTLNIKAKPLVISKAHKIAADNKINLCTVDEAHLTLSLDETVSFKDMRDLIAVFAEAASVGAPKVDDGEFEKDVELSWPDDLQRSSEYLTHPVFHMHRSETQMMRYIKSLERRDLSLTTSMIPLGSCTMKLNPATAMLPISWPEFGQLHPFIPQNQAAGYTEVIDDMRRIVREITGLADVSLQPNSGAQGEYAGLMVIRAYFKDRGETHRNITLVPTSAHGTNPASANMAGMQIVSVKCDENGNVDVADLRAKAEKHMENLAALMITYPSTHGVFEEDIREICDIIHTHGGQVYMDGANMNAQVGLTSPGVIGADVCHLNLHKTFSIPHGGGGPGMGPIAVAKHLAPFLPGHPVIKTGGEKAISAISATPYGSSSILLISYAYMLMLGGDGMRAATEQAIINANYIKERLKGHYDVLYAGRNGHVGHEMIIDLRRFRKEAGVEVEDIAKRLMDYGFHAPTVSWPVPGTMMIEPTESESREELDRFCEAMIHIYKEMQEIAAGKADKEDNVLKNAPHTAEEVTSDNWEHAYSREQAAFPADYIRFNKFWPAVARVDNTYGDRNLVCACPPMEEYE